MENTLTIDPGLYDELRLRAEAEQLAVEDLAAKFIRAGIDRADNSSRFQQSTKTMGAKFDWKRMKELDAEMEVEEFNRLMKPRE
jgi:hypothetical protein